MAEDDVIEMDERDIERLILNSIGKKFSTIKDMEVLGIGENNGPFDDAWTKGKVIPPDAVRLHEAETPDYFATFMLRRRQPKRYGCLAYSFDAYLVRGFFLVRNDKVVDAWYYIDWDLIPEAYEDEPCGGVIVCDSNDMMRELRGKGAGCGLKWCLVPENPEKAHLLRRARAFRKMRRHIIKTNYGRNV